MNDNDKAISVLAQAIRKAVHSCLASAPFDITIVGKVVSRDSSGLYTVELNGKHYKAKAQGSVQHTAGAVVRILVPQNNYEDLWILAP
ncbi:hypothetical protein [Gehongia tenuis]|uniref:Uncharacterized protein n=1 Tax=Gehongia tenuis TaxID=2763655 RepID=A0A926D5U7_9FIRM|nr:hypothetical protein [Gehongia tenuis]MBC8531928.1 hypothetical protein [Gehongia tenuis]